MLIPPDISCVNDTNPTSRLQACRLSATVSCDILIPKLLIVGHMITISGDLGSGKTSVSRLLSTRLGYEYVCIGEIHRRIAQEMGMNLLEFNLFAESDPRIDERIDSSLAALIESHLSYVIESRVAWYFFKNSLKAYLLVDPAVGAARVMSDTLRRNEPLYANPAHAMTQLAARRQSENRRYLSLYGIDCSNLRNYDVVLDSTALTVEQTVEQLYAATALWRNGQSAVYDRNDR